jgi:Ca2+-binding RTX toxin-like protein
MRARRAILAGLGALAALALPGSGVAGPPSPTFSVTDGPNGKLIVAGNPDANRLTVFYGTQTGPGRFQISVSDVAEQTISEDSTHCVPSNLFPDEIVFCDYNINTFALKLGPGNDRFFPARDGSDQPWPAAVKLTENGGPGNDVVRGAEGNDSLKGSSGKDKLIGRDGADKLNARDGTSDRRIDCGRDDDPKPRTDPVDPDPVSC